MTESPLTETGPQPEDQPHGSWVSQAAGRAATRSARAAARAWLGPLEAVADDVLSAPEAARIMDHMLAGPLPEEFARSIVRNRVMERIVTELADSGELERLVASAVESPRTAGIADEVLASDAARIAVRHIAASPELRYAISEQTTGLAEQLFASVRASARRLDDRAERLVRRPARLQPVEHAGIVTRGVALAVDTALTLILFMSVVGTTALVSSLVGGLRPDWLVGVLLASGWALIAGLYFVLFWSSVGQTPGMRLLHVRVDGPSSTPPAVGRSLVRLIGLVLSIVPMFAGFIPVLFTERRRGLADLLAGTVVAYESTIFDRPG